MKRLFWFSLEVILQLQALSETPQTGLGLCSKPSKMWSQCASAVSTCSAGWSLGSITSHPLPQSLLLVFHQPGSLTPTPPSVPILAIFCGQPKPYLSHRNVSAASFHNTCFLFYMTLDKLRSPSPECFAVQLLSCV